MIDGKAQEVFQNGDSLKGFLDFMGQCKPQRTDNLFLLYGTESGDPAGQDL